MRWMSTAFITSLFKRDHSSYPLPVMDSQPDSLCSTTEPRAIASESTFWRKCIEIFHCRRLAELEKDLRTEREARLLLEGQVTVQRSEIERWSQMAEDAIRNERIVYQTRMNVDMQQKYGFAMFPDAPMIPSEMYSDARPAQIEPDYVSARSLQAEKVSEFFTRGKQLHSKATS